MKSLRVWLSIGVSLLVLLGVVVGDGLIIAPPPELFPLAIKYHEVAVVINEQVALTKIEQVFVNKGERTIKDAWYIFPLPEGAIIDKFSVEINGSLRQAQVLDAEEARVFYQEMVKQSGNPALLEYADKGLFKCHVGSFEPDEEKKVMVEYTQIIRSLDRLCEYIYPLNTEKFSTELIEKVSVRVTLKQTSPILNIYSPSHPITIEREDEYRAVVHYAEEKVKPVTDFVLYFLLSPEDFDLSLLTYREKGEEGFFLLILSPRYGISAGKQIDKDIVFVIDRSGSMRGEKIVQAREALKFCVSALPQGDYFNIISFATQVTPYKAMLQPANSANISSALAYISEIKAEGSTNINQALLDGLSMLTNIDERPNYILFLTDGLPTEGVTNEAQIVSNISKANTNSTRLFVFGVGYDVNVHLLDKLSLGNNGLSVYVKPKANLEVAISEFFKKISAPVLTDIALTYEGITVGKCYPSELPDIFKGSQIIILGRYSGSGSASICLSGRVQNEQQEFRYSAYFPEEQLDYPFVARLWAARRVAVLSDKIALEGEKLPKEEKEALVDEIVALGKKYGIVTPYTSALIMEGDTPAHREEFYKALNAESGALAFNTATDRAGLRNAENAQAFSHQRMKIVEGRVFIMKVSEDEPTKWIDTRYQEGEPTQKIEFGSDEYFALINQKPELSKYFSVGRNVIVKFEGKNYEIVDSLGSIDEPKGSRFLPGYPSPANIGIWLPCSLSENGDKVKITIYNILGQVVREIQVSKLKAQNFIHWDGCDANGRKVPTGIYFYELRAGKSSQKKKALLIR